MTGSQPSAAKPGAEICAPSWVAPVPVVQPVLAALLCTCQLPPRVVSPAEPAVTGRAACGRVAPDRAADDAARAAAAARACASAGVPDRLSAARLARLRTAVTARSFMVTGLPGGLGLPFFSG